MAILTRQTQKVFSSNANADQLAVFGSMKTGTPQYSSNLADLQSVEYTQGWTASVKDDKAPFLEEMNAIQYGFSYQLAYLLQEGIPEYDANTEYSNTSIVKSVDDGIITLYSSLVNNNVGNPLTNTTYWKATVLNLDVKANVDLSNMTPSQTVKDTIVNWGMPDYTKGISISLPYTCTFNGYVNTPSNSSAGGGRSLYINDKLVWQLHYTASGGDTGGGFIAPVSVGDVISGSVGSPQIFPLKGDE